MIVTDGFVKAMIECDAASGGLVMALCTGPIPTLEQLRKSHGVVDRLYFQGPTEPTLRTIAQARGGDVVSRIYWATLQPLVGKGKMSFALSTLPTQQGFVFQDCVPTYAVLLWNRSAVTNSVAIWNSVSTVAHAACFNIGILSVGDENSSADIKIKGGKLYAGSRFQPADLDISYAGNSVIS